MKHLAVPEVSGSRQGSNGTNRSSSRPTRRSATEAVGVVASAQLGAGGGRRGSKDRKEVATVQQAISSASAAIGEKPLGSRTNASPRSTSATRPRRTFSPPEELHARNYGRASMGKTELSKRFSNSHLDAGSRQAEACREAHRLEDAPAAGAVEKTVLPRHDGWWRSREDSVVTPRLHRAGGRESSKAPPPYSGGRESSKVAATGTLSESGLSEASSQGTATTAASTPTLLTSAARLRSIQATKGAIAPSGSRGGSIAGSRHGSRSGSVKGSRCGSPKGSQFGSPQGSRCSTPRAAPSGIDMVEGAKRLEAALLKHKALRQEEGRQSRWVSI